MFMWHPKVRRPHLKSKNSEEIASSLLQHFTNGDVGKPGNNKAACQVWTLRLALNFGISIENC